MNQRQIEVQEFNAKYKTKSNDGNAVCYIMHNQNNEYYSVTIMTRNEYGDFTHKTIATRCKHETAFRKAEEAIRAYEAEQEAAIKEYEADRVTDFGNGITEIKEGENFRYVDGAGNEYCRFTAPYGSKTIAITYHDPEDGDVDTDPEYDLENARSFCHGYANANFIERIHNSGFPAEFIVKYYGVTRRTADNIIRRCAELNEEEIDACIARHNIDIKALSKNDKINGYDLTAFFGVPVGLAEGVMRRIRAERDAAEEEQTEAAEEPDDGITEIVYDEGHIEYLTDNGFGEAEVLVSIEEFDEGYMVWKHIQLLGGTEWIASRKTIAEAKELAEHTIKRHREMEARLKEVRDDPHEFNRVLAEYE